MRFENKEEKENAWRMSAGTHSQNTHVGSFGVKCWFFSVVDSGFSVFKQTGVVKVRQLGCVYYGTHSQPLMVGASLLLFHQSKISADKVHLPQHNIWYPSSFSEATEDKQTCLFSLSLWVTYKLTLLRPVWTPTAAHERFSFSRCHRVATQSM